MGNYVSGMKTCGKCGQEKISVNEEQKCLRCDSEPGTSTLMVTADDPGEDKINEMLMKAGVAVPKLSKTPERVQLKQPVQPVVLQQGMPFDMCVKEALKLMQKVPMPKDVKQFKAVAKIIAALEALIGEANGI